MSASTLFAPRQSRLSLPQRLRHLDWLIVLLLAGIAGIGVAMLYSVANGDFSPWAARHAFRFAAGLALLLAAAMVDIRTWLMLAWPAYLGALILLGAVDVIGVVGMGSRRWLDLGVFQLQPSELMKVTTVLAIARYYHGLGADEAQRFVRVLIPLLLIALPTGLVMVQPDLGTGLLILAAGVVVIFLGGASKWLFIGGGALTLAAIPVGWSFLRDYQKSRVLSFLNPESDPLGAGYQVMQSKIALGSGGVDGKGFLDGTQSHLNFLPEMKTDFIFTVLAEEFGLLGGLFVLMLYAILIFYGLRVALLCRSQFGRLLAAGLAATLFLHVFINVAMVMGLLPVVGVPLPLISYGGTIMMTTLLSFGILLSVSLDHRVVIPRGV